MCEVCQPLASYILFYYRSPFTTTEAAIICLSMFLVSGIFAARLFFSASITTIISLDNFSTFDGYNLKDFQICQRWSPKTFLRQFRTGYQVMTCFLQFFLPLLLVVSTTHIVKLLYDWLHNWNVMYIHQRN